MNEPMRPETELRLRLVQNERRRAEERSRNQWRAVCVLLALVIAGYLVWRLR